VRNPDGTSLSSNADATPESGGGIRSQFTVFGVCALRVKPNLFAHCCFEQTLDRNPKLRVVSLSSHPKIPSACG